jgi:hypothetical protein
LGNPTVLVPRLLRTYIRLAIREAIMDYPERLARRHRYKPPSDPAGELTKEVEDATASVPSSAFLGIALGATAVAFFLQTAGTGKWGNFLGQWVPTWLLLGVYSKLLKLEDRYIARDASDRGSYFL